MVAITSKLLQLILCYFLVAFVEGERFTLLFNCRLLQEPSGTTGGNTSGFIELSLLKKRADKIPNGENARHNLDENFRLVGGMRFTCSGSLTGVLLAVDVRPVIPGVRDQYPLVEIWTPRPGQNGFYDRRGSQHIILEAGDFSPDGVLQYNLSVPLSFQNGDVFGVWQPSISSSVVRLYDVTGDTQLLSYQTDSYPVSYNVVGTILVTKTILIHAITTSWFCSTTYAYH